MYQCNVIVKLYYFQEEEDEEDEPKAKKAKTANNTKGKTPVKNNLKANKK